jgi:hypothetical protein
MKRIATLKRYARLRRRNPPSSYHYRRVLARRRDGAK